MSTSYLIPPLDADVMAKAPGGIYTIFDADAKTILVDTDNLKAFLDATGMKVKEEFPSGYDGIVGVILVPAETKPTIAIEAKRKYKVHNAKDTIAPYITKILEDEVAPILDRDIEVTYFATPTQAVEKILDKSFNIFYGTQHTLFVDPTPAAKPETTWGISLRAMRAGCTPAKSITSNFFMIYAEDGVYPLAMLSADKNCLYLLGDMLYNPSNKAMQAHCAILFKHIIAAAIKIIFDKELTKAVEPIFNEEWIKSEETTRKVLNFDESMIQKNEHKVEELKNKVLSYQTELVAALRTKEMLSRQLADMREFGLNVGKRAAEQIVQLKRMPNIKGVDVAMVKNEMVILLYTNMLYCTDPRSGKEHEIGEFIISLNFTRAHIHWFNTKYAITTSAGSNMHAPHVFGDGHACLGTWNNVIPEVMAQGDITTAANMAIAFIESVNVADDAGKYIDKWPLSQRAATASTIETTAKAA